jgi:hypothetical protein
MEETDYFRALIRQGIHEATLVGRHPNFAAFEHGRNVVMETEFHL